MVNTRKASRVKKAISPKPSTDGRGRAPGYITFFKNGSGWCVRYDKNAKQQATSVKQQASSSKLFEMIDASIKA